MRKFILAWMLSCGAAHASSLPPPSMSQNASNAVLPTARVNLGLGSIATQNSTSVSVTGGSIDGAAVGATTPSTGTFTTLITNGVTVTPPPSVATTTPLTGTGSAGSVQGATGPVVFPSHIGVSVNAPAISGCTGCSLDATASDTAGTLTEGTLQTGVVLTWHTAYATAPHCVVSSPSGAALTSYSATTTTLTLVNASATGDAFTYVCVQ
jgi:hypothetical protein